MRKHRTVVLYRHSDGTFFVHLRFFVYKGDARWTVATGTESGVISTSLAWHTDRCYSFEDALSHYEYRVSVMGTEGFR